jgi:hypothetical protein
MFSRTEVSSVSSSARTLDLPILATASFKSNAR